MEIPDFYNDLELMKTKIESMDKQHHIEIFKILKNNPSVKTNENKSGVFINLSVLPPDTLEEIKKYVGYIHDQEKTLQTVEYQKEEFKNTFFIAE